MIRNTLHRMPPWVYWDGLLNDEELKNIIDHCDAQTLELGTVGSTATKTSANTTIRDSGIKFIAPSSTNQWFFDKLNWVIDEINNKWYGFDLEGYINFQYTTYDASKGNQHYDEHMDTFLGELGPMRKLSLSFVLNDEFEGGEFYIKLGSKDEELPQKAGRILAFPSFLMHGVKPVTAGIRKSIVVWVLGPIFK